MQHGILNALRQTQAQDNSLETLSQLPQVEIMRMVQSGSIGKDMLLPIMSKKAQMADKAAKLKAVEQGGGQQASILEKKMAQIAQAENPVNTMQTAMQPQMQAQAPMTAENTGVAQLPVPPRTYAGGGIVAFQNNPDQPVDYRMPARDEEGNLMPINEAPAKTSFGQDLQDIKNWARTTYDEANNALIKKPAQELKNYFTNPAAPTIATAPVPAQARKEPGIVIHDDKNKGTGKPSIANAARDAYNQAPEQSDLAKYLEAATKNLEGSAEERKAARKEARDMRLLQAGLGIAGGTSPYFFTNVGQGAAPAAQGYGEDIKALRVEDADRRKQLAALGLKGVELKQAEKELAAKVPLYGAQTQQALANASYLRSGKGAGLGLGNLPAKEVNTMLAVVDEFTTTPNPQNPLWKYIPPELQKKFTIAKPGNPIYEQGKTELARMMPQIERAYMARTAQYTGKRGTASLITDE